MTCKQNIMFRQSLNILNIKEEIENKQLLDKQLRKLRDSFTMFTKTGQKNEFNNKQNNNKKMINICKTIDTAKIPTLGSSEAGAYDLYSPVDINLLPGKLTIVNIGIKIELPPKMCARLLARSSFALKNIRVEAGLIDNDYRGEIKVVFSNNGEQVFKIKQGDRIAQMKLEKYYNQFKFNLTDKLSNTTRNENGFGSTGK